MTKRLLLRHAVKIIEDATHISVLNDDQEPQLILTVQQAQCSVPFYYY